MWFCTYETRVHRQICSFLTFNSLNNLWVSHENNWIVSNENKVTLR